MTTAGIATQKTPLPLKHGFVHSGQGIMGSNSCWTNRHFENSYTFSCSLRAPTQHISGIGHISKPIMNGHCYSENCLKVHLTKTGFLHLDIPIVENLSTNYVEDHIVSSLKKLSMNTGSGNEKTPPHTPVKSGPPQFSAIPSHDRSSRPLPPLPISEDHYLDDADSEVEFFTSSDTDLLLRDNRPLAFKYGVPSRRSFRGCGQINYAYCDPPSVNKPVDESPTSNQNEPTPSSKPQQSHRKLRRSHSGPAGSYNKPAIRIGSHINRTPPNSDEEKPEVPPRIPIPPRSLKPDHRRWSAEVSSNTYSDEDKPPKLPPREPLSRSNSRTPSPKSLPSYLYGIMPPTQSFAPDPKYVSSKTYQRQNSEGSVSNVPCILPIIENGKKASSTHYYLLPETSCLVGQI